MTDAHAHAGHDDGVSVCRSYGRGRRLLWTLVLLLTVVVRLPAALTSYPTPEEFAYVGGCRALVEHGRLDELATQGETALSGWVGAAPLVFLDHELVPASESPALVVDGISVVHRASWITAPDSTVLPWVVVALLRLPGLLLACVAVTLARRLGHRAFGRLGGWIAALLWTLAPPVIEADVALSGLRLVGPAALAVVLFPMWLHDSIERGGRPATIARRRLTLAAGLALAATPALWPLCALCAVGTVLWRRHAIALGDKAHSGAPGRYVAMVLGALAVPWLLEAPVALFGPSGMSWYPAQLVEATNALFRTPIDWTLAPLTVGLRLPLAVIATSVIGVVAWPTLRLDRPGGPTWLLAALLVPWTLALVAPVALVPGLVLAGLPGALGLGAAAITRHAVDADRTARLGAGLLVLLAAAESVPHLLRPRAHRNGVAAALPEILPTAVDRGESSWQLILLANALQLEHVRYLHALPAEAFDLLADEHAVLRGAGELIELRSDLRAPLPASGRMVALSDATTDLVALPDHAPVIRLGGLHLFDAR